MAEAIDNSREAAREERKKKIRELEATLFGADNDWISHKTDLPELQSVDEYASKYGFAEAKKPQTQKLPRLKTANKPSAFLKTINRVRSSSLNHQEAVFDGIPLINDDDDDDDDEEEDVNGHDPNNKDQQLQEADNAIREATKRRQEGKKKKDGRPTMSKAQRLLKSEVEQLDQAFGKIFYEEPHQSVIDNLKKRHGLIVSSTAKPRYEHFDHYQPSSTDPTTVDSFREKMSRAQILDRIPPTARPRNLSLNKSFEDHQPSAGSRSPNPLVDKRRRFSALLPDEMTVIGKKLQQKPKTPEITVDPSPKQRRTIPSIQIKDRLNVKTPSTTEDNGMISYDNLEKIPANLSDGTFDNMNGTFDRMPTNTFDDIPSDVFENIPRAVTAREERRHVKLQEHLRDNNTIAARQAASDVDDEAATLQPKVSFIAALFSTDKRRGSSGGSTDAMASSGHNPAGLSDDFMFALFIAQQPDDSALTNDDAPSRGDSRRPPPPPPDPNDLEVGHFCAPFAPGFCAANFCIFHNPIIGSDAAAGQEPRVLVQED